MTKTQQSRSDEARENLLTTWLEFRSVVYGESRADTIRMVNEGTGKQYTNSTFYSWITQRVSATDPVLDIINQDLAEMLDWLFKTRGWDKGSCINYAELASKLKTPIKS